MKKWIIKDKYKKNILRIYAGILILGVLYAAFIHISGWMLPCMLHRITGFYCPGCGMTRACLALIHGHIGLAFMENGAVVSLLIFWFIYSIGVLYHKFTFLRNKKLLYTLLSISVGILIIFGIIRNFPSFWFLRPFNFSL